MSGNKKSIKLQRVSTDVREKIKSTKFNCLAGNKDLRINLRGTNPIANTKISNENINTYINTNASINKQLNKSIESHNNYSAKFRLSKTSDFSQKRQQSKNNKTMLINRINMNKKDINNPFFQTDS